MLSCMHIHIQIHRQTDIPTHRHTYTTYTTYVTYRLTVTLTIHTYTYTVHASMRYIFISIQYLILY